MYMFISEGIMVQYACSYVKQWDRIADQEPQRMFYVFTGMLVLIILRSEIV